MQMWILWNSQAPFALSSTYVRECPREIPLLEWSPTLSFGSPPDRVFNQVHRSSGEIIEYSDLPIAPEITSFQCRYFFTSYRNCQHLFHTSLNLPHHFVSNDFSYVCFMFEENMGLRLVSIRLWPRHHQMVDRLDDAARAFSRQLDFTEAGNVSYKISERRPETVVVVGRNIEEGGDEVNIEFFDRRFPPAGGPRAHNQLLEVVEL
ncbi:hypothetical protein HDU79_007175 [Rhizoclosmatium sp. JEL0117]|nr:hypothetical protein HDU79_007175 [Rhizoclosmatium sp. JEL0117]